MTYEVRLNHAADRDLDRLDPVAQQRVVERLEALADNPRPAGSAALQGALKGLRRLRVGDYRVSYLVDAETRTVTVMQIGHRRNVYQQARRRKR